MSEFQKSNIGILALAAIAAVIVAVPALGQDVKVTTKSLKDATHIEISGLNEWRYEVSRKNANDHTHVFVQLTGVRPADLQSLRALKDSRVSAVEVKSGTNDDALVEFTLSDNKLGFFDYQTEAPANLILDIYKEEAPVAATTSASQSKVKSSGGKKGAAKMSREEILSTLVVKSAKKIAAGKKGKNGRNVASVDHPEIGEQPLLGDQGNSSLQLKYGIFDGGDQNLTRFKIDDKDIKESALIKSERNMYLHFPMLSYNRPSLKDVLNETPSYDVPPVNSDENQQVRLIVKLFNEGKYAVVLRTLKFLYEKYPQTSYQKTLDFVTAETYLKLWQRDHSRSDFEEAMARFKEILDRYPKDDLRYRTLMLIGMNYVEIGNNLGALSTFQVGVKNFPDSPYFWQMRMQTAETLNALDKDKAALAELDEIENSPLSKDYAVEARYRRGDVFFQAKNYAAAVKEYQSAVDKYPDKWAQGPNAFFNAAESSFWLRDYKGALAKFRDFLQRFPLHNYGGYAMTRIGEILQILGADQRKYEGAYLESYFRYHDSPGAFVAKVHINTSRYGTMKEKELQAAREELKTEMPGFTIQDLDTFVTLNEADGFWSRKHYDVSNEMLIKYYQSNTLSPYLPLFKHRIIQNFTSTMDSYNQKKEYMKALETYIKNGDSWLKQSDKNFQRVDTHFIAGQSYEALNVPSEATKLYEKCLNMDSSFSPTEIAREKVFENLPSMDELNLRLAAVSLKAEDIKRAALHLGDIKDPTGLTSAEQVERSLILSSVAEKEEKPDLALLALNDLTEHWKDKGKNEDILLVEPWLRMARINLSLKKYSEATPWVEKAVSAAKENAATINHDLARESLDLAADVYVKTDKINSAIESYKTYLDKFADHAPTAPVKYKLGKLYFDQKNYHEASRVWDSLKDENDGELWGKMAKEQMAQAQWNEKYNRYLDRKPAGGNQ